MPDASHRLKRRQQNLNKDLNIDNIENPLHFLRFRRQFKHPDLVRRRFWPVVAEVSSDIA